jgi:hypothetical protein
MAGNLHFQLRFHPAAYLPQLDVIPTVLRFAVSLSDDVCLVDCRDTLK